MSLTLPKPDTAESLADLHERLGGIPLARIRYRPLPGTAGEEDLLLSERPCELVDGVLVEKPMGFYESRIGLRLGRLIDSFAEAQDLGFTLGEAGPVRVFTGRVRMPDISFVSWRHFPDRRLPGGSILNVAPDLAVEILSPGNTPAEMGLKREEYFEAGCRLVWEVDPESRSVRVFTGPQASSLLGAADVLTGGEILPGFTVPVAGLFPPRSEPDTSRL